MAESANGLLTMKGVPTITPEGGAPTGVILCGSTLPFYFIYMITIIFIL